MVRCGLTCCGAECPPGAGEIAHTEAVLHEQTARKVAALAALARGDDFLVLRQFAQASPQFVQRDVK